MSYLLKIFNKGEKMRKLTTIILILAFLTSLANTAQAFTLVELLEVLSLIGDYNLGNQKEIPLPSLGSGNYEMLCYMIGPDRICKFE